MKFLICRISLLALWFLAVAPLAVCGQPVAPELIFQTGFEGNSALVPYRGSGGSDQLIIGCDTTLNGHNDFDEVFGKKGVQKGQVGSYGFLVQYQGGDISQRFAKIVSEPGNPTNQVLWFWLHDKYACGGQVKGRVQVNLYDLKPGLPEFYQSVRVFLTEDWNVVRNYPRALNWCTISEFWNKHYLHGTADYDKGFRITLGIGKPTAAVSDLSFILDADGLDWKRVWIARNEQVKVPIGKWFTMEYYYKEGDSQNGRFYLAITPDGQPRQVVYDLTARTRTNMDPAPPAGITDYNPLKLYTSNELLGFVKSQGKTLQIYWDDFKLWKNRQPVDSKPLLVIEEVQKPTTPKPRSGGTASPSAPVK